MARPLYVRCMHCMLQRTEYLMKHFIVHHTSWYSFSNDTSFLSVTAWWSHFLPPGKGRLCLPDTIGTHFSVNLARPLYVEEGFGLGSW